MTYNTRAVVLLGLLDLDDSTLNAPTGAPDLVETRGHWRVEHHKDISVWKCLCGRSQPILVPARLRNVVTLPNNLIQACEVCRDEYARATSKSGEFLAWLERNRPIISSDACLEYPDDRGYTFSHDDGRNTRTRRVVFEAFFKRTLRSDQYVTSVCKNPLCINPYHLCVSSAPRKTGPTVTAAIIKMAELGLSAKVTQHVLKDKFKTQLCISTISAIRQEFQPSRLIPS